MSFPLPVLQDRAWRWNRFESQVDDDMEQAACLTESDEGIGHMFSETEDGFAVLSHSPSSDDADSKPCKLAELLTTWGSELCPEDLPVVVMPSPVCYLLMHGKLNYLTLQCNWHARLVDRHGNRYANQPLFSSTIVHVAV